MRLKILFIGGTVRGLRLLEMLKSHGEDIVYAYIMKEDRHETVKSSIAIKKLCKKHAIPNVICRKIKHADSRELLSLKPDVAFVCGWRTIIPPIIYKSIKYGCLAAHDSLLPKYRGFAPLNWAIISGDKKTGVTLFRIMDGTVDSGDIFSQKKVKIAANDTASDVYPRIIEATLSLFSEFIITQKKGALRWRSQNEDSATYACKRMPSDGEINWNRPAKEIFNLIRALSPPYPCAWTRYNGKKIYIAGASLPQKTLKFVGNIPGRVVSAMGGEILVLCGIGQIIVNKIKVSSGAYKQPGTFFSSIRVTFGK